MAWTVCAIDGFNRLDRAIRREIVDYLENRVGPEYNPRLFGKALRHDLAGLWRYRVRDYRIVCQIRNETMTVLVAGVGHRRDVYR